MTDAQHHREATAGMTSKKLTSRLAKRWISKKVEPLMADSSGKCKGCYLSVNASGFSLSANGLKAACWCLHAWY